MRRLILCSLMTCTLGAIAVALFVFYFEYHLYEPGWIAWMGTGILAVLGGMVASTLYLRRPNRTKAIVSVFAGLVSLAMMAIVGTFYWSEHSLAKDYDVTPPSDMVACTSFSDCAVEFSGCDGCCGVVAIHRAKREAYRKFHTARCRGYHGGQCDCMPVSWVAVCQNNRCQTESGRAVSVTGTITRDASDAVTAKLSLLPNNNAGNSGDAAPGEDRVDVKAIDEKGRQFTYAFPIWRDQSYTRDSKPYAMDATWSSGFVSASANLPQSVREIVFLYRGREIARESRQAPALRVSELTAKITPENKVLLRWKSSTRPDRDFSVSFLFRKHEEPDNWWNRLPLHHVNIREFTFDPTDVNVFDGGKIHVRVTLEQGLAQTSAEVVVNIPKPRSTPAPSE